jgi:hypothetical protein
VNLFVDGERGFDGAFGYLYDLAGLKFLIIGDCACNFAIKAIGKNQLALQSDGNLVIFSQTGAALWNSGTWGNPGAFLAIQNDGNMVIYSSGGAALWWPGTGGR